MSSKNRIVGTDAAGRWTSTKLTKIPAAILVGPYSPSQGAFIAGNFKKLSGVF